MLVYHAICSAPAGADAAEKDMFVDPDRFAGQMADLASRGYRTLRLDEYWQALTRSTAASRSLLLTFDDAYAHVDNSVTPILRRYGFTAAMFTCPAHLGQRNTWDKDHPYLRSLEIATADHVSAMAADRWELASHALRHVDLRGLPRSQRQAELIESRQRLSDLAGRPVRDLAYPYGLHDASVREDARLAGFRMAFTAGGGRRTDARQLPRRPVRGPDGTRLFRLKASSADRWLYDAKELAPNWTRRLARNAVKAAHV